MKMYEVRERIQMYSDKGAIPAWTEVLVVDTFNTKEEAVEEINRLLGQRIKVLNTMIVMSMEDDSPIRIDGERLWKEIFKLEKNSTMFYNGAIDNGCNASIYFVYEVNNEVSSDQMDKKGFS